MLVRLGRKEESLNRLYDYEYLIMAIYLNLNLFSISLLLWNRTPVPGGLSLREGAFLVEEVCRTGCLSSLDLVEVNPKLGDKSDVETTLNSAMLIIKSALGEKLALLCMNYK